MIYTNYFGQLKNLPTEMVPLSIARFSPKYYHGAKCERLAPSKEIFNLDGDDFDKAFKKEVLNNMELEWLKQTFLKTVPLTEDNLPVWMSKTNHIVLMCYEKDPFECHRSLVAEKLTKLGIECTEFDAFNAKCQG